MPEQRLARAGRELPETERGAARVDPVDRGRRQRRTPGGIGRERRAVAHCGTLRRVVRVPCVRTAPLPAGDRLSPSCAPCQPVRDGRAAPVRLAAGSPLGPSRASSPVTGSAGDADRDRWPALRHPSTGLSTGLSTIRRTCGHDCGQWARGRDRVRRRRSRPRAARSARADRSASPRSRGSAERARARLAAGRRPRGPPGGRPAPRGRSPRASQAVARAAATAARGTSGVVGRPRTNADPQPGTDATARSPPIARARSRLIGRPSPVPGTRSWPASRANGWKIRSRSARSIPGPSSRTTTRATRSAIPAATSTRPPSGVNLQAFAGEVRDDLLEAAPVGPRGAQAWREVDRQADRAVGRQRGERRQRPLAGLGQRDRLDLQAEAARLEPAHLEEVADEGRHPLDDPPAALDELVPDLGVVDGAAGEQVEVAAEAGQRRPQLVGHDGDEPLALALARPQVGELRLDRHPRARRGEGREEVAERRRREGGRPRAVASPGSAQLQAELGVSATDRRGRGSAPRAGRPRRRCRSARAVAGPRGAVARPARAGSARWHAGCARSRRRPAGGRRAPRAGRGPGRRATPRAPGRLRDPRRGPRQRGRGARASAPGRRPAALRRLGRRGRGGRPAATRGRRARRGRRRRARGGRAPRGPAGPRRDAGRGAAPRRPAGRGSWGSREFGRVAFHARPRVRAGTARQPSPERRDGPPGSTGTSRAPVALRGPAATWRPRRPALVSPSGERRRGPAGRASGGRRRGPRRRTGPPRLARPPCARSPGRGPRGP